MTTRMTINGVSTCQTAGTEKYESSQMSIGRERAHFRAIRLPPYRRRVVLLREAHAGRVQAVT